MTEHSIPEGQAYCSRCGTSRAHLEKDPTTPCVPSKADERPRPFASAMNDLDAIRARIEELRAEESAALAGEGAK